MKKKLIFLVFFMLSQGTINGMMLQVPADGHASVEDIFAILLEKAKSFRFLSYEGRVYRDHDGRRELSARGTVYVRRILAGQDEEDEHAVDMRINADLSDLEGGTNYREFLKNREEFLVKNPDEETILLLDSPYAQGMIAGEAMQLAVEQLFNPQILERMLEENWKLEGIEVVSGDSCYVLTHETTRRRQGRSYDVRERLEVGTKDFSIHRKTYNSITREVTSLHYTDVQADSLFTFEDSDSYVFSTFDLTRDRNPKAENNLLAYGMQAPNWELADFDDHTYSLSNYRGKVLLIDFWATWCAPCKKAVPVLNELQKTYAARGLEVVGINTFESVSNLEYLRQFVRDGGYEYTVLLNGDETARKYKVFGLPTFYVIGRDGKVLYSDFGAPPTLKEKLEPVIREALYRGE